MDSGKYINTEQTQQLEEISDAFKRNLQEAQDKAFRNTINDIRSNLVITLKEKLKQNSLKFVELRLAEIKSDFQKEFDDFRETNKSHSQRLIAIEERILKMENDQKHIYQNLDGEELKNPETYEEIIASILSANNKETIITKLRSIDFNSITKDTLSYDTIYNLANKLLDLIVDENVTALDS